jgi:DNA topoisomerase-1
LLPLPDILSVNKTSLKFDLQNFKHRLSIECWEIASLHRFMQRKTDMSMKTDDAREASLPSSGSEAVATARQVGLRHVSDDMPGISRKRLKNGFRYLDADGKPVRDEAELARIKSLAIPPTWTDVWICPWDNGHIQAVGRDARKRKQYRYHPRWRSVRD